ncbi:MAG: glycosyltransferase [Pseudomonadota bacterium]|nr:glycosyltransferase [Pseudomonadota bacterium]
MAPPPPRPRVALVDGGSFVLPYDYELARLLGGQGIDVDFHGSLSRYNAPFLAAIAGLSGARVFAHAVSRTVAPRWRGIVAYSRMWFGVLRARRRYSAVNLQFSAWWPLELPFLLALRRRLVYTVHNAVPHGFRGRCHAPTARIAGLARTLVFVSQSSHDDFIERYGERFRAKSRIVPHPPLPMVAGMGPTPYRPLPAMPEALVYWSTVKPYKGVELMVEVARSGLARQRQLGLEVWGRWDPGLAVLRAETQALGVRVEDRYLESDEMLMLFARPLVFILPYVEASQSGALYALLAHGCYFICADVGDLGSFMRRFGLEALLLRERSGAAVLACVDALAAAPEHWARAFAAAQLESSAAAERAVAQVYASSLPPCPTLT